MLLPVLGLVWLTFMQESPSADWWQYMAAPGLLACAGAAASKWRMAMPLCCVALVFFLIQTWRRASIYHSMATYCATVTEEDPQAWTLQNNLGILFKRAGHFAEAEACYRQALTDNPGFVEAHVNMANAMDVGDPWNLASGAETELLQAQEMQSRRSGDHTADLVGVCESKGGGGGDFPVIPGRRRRNFAMRWRWRPQASRCVSSSARRWCGLGERVRRLRSATRLTGWRVRLAARRRGMRRRGSGATVRDRGGAGSGERGAGSGERGVRSAECGVRSAECGVRSAECGGRSAECGVRSAECGVRSAECGMRNAECGMRFLRFAWEVEVAASGNCFRL